MYDYISRHGTPLRLSPFALVVAVIHTQSRPLAVTVAPRCRCPYPFMHSHAPVCLPACLDILQKQKGRWKKALSLLVDIPSRGLELNAHVYGSAIRACVVGGEQGRALALLGEMLERRVVPDAAVFTAAMTAVDGWGAALRLLVVMKREVSPDFQ